jgi:hypothetical protein
VSTKVGFDFIRIPAARCSDELEELLRRGCGEEWGIEHRGTPFATIRCRNAEAETSSLGHGIGHVRIAARQVEATKMGY